MIYAYVTCGPNIGYAITTMNKFSTKPSTSHYKLLKRIAKYLRETKDWWIKYKQSVMRDDLAPTILKSDAVYDKSFSAFPVDTNQPKLTTFVNAGYANNQHK